jgi:hypothetical protein
MAPESNELTQDWSQLQQAGEALATLLVEAAERLANAGLPPTVNLLDQVRQFRTQLSEFRNQIDPDCPAERAAIEDHVAYGAVESTLSKHASRVRLQRLLERVLTLRHIDDSGYAPLEVCRDSARQLLAQPRASQATAWQELSEGRHPLQALVTQVEGAADLSDDAWAGLGDLLTRSYGRSLATTAARGKLWFGEHPVPPAESATSPAEGAMAGLVVEAVTTLVGLSESPAPLVQCEPAMPHNPDLHAPDIVTGPSFLDADCPFNPLNPSSSLTLALASSREVKVTPLPESGNESAVTVPVEPQSNDAPEADQQSNQTSCLETLEEPVPVVALPDPDIQVATQEGSATAELPQEWIATPVSRAQAQQSPFSASAMVDTTIFDVPAPSLVRVHRSVEELAQLAAATDESRRVPLLTELQIELLRIGRYSLAYQLTRCLETRTSRHKSFLPLWLVRTLALGERLVFPKGSLALQLQQDFGEFRRDSLLRGDKEWNEALGFFLRAAAIRPAVLAPASRASGVLQAVGINENLCHLYNYCSRIIRFADQDQGDVLQQLRPNEYEGPRSLEYRQLLQDIDHWRSLNAHRSVEYTSQTPLFSHEHWTLRAATAVKHADEARQWAQWQKLQRIVNDLLAPVTTHEIQAAGWVRQEVQRLSAEIDRGGDEIAGSRRSHFDAQRLALPSEEMRCYLEDAISFANRWLTLQGPLPPAIGDAFVPVELQELRNSILERHEPALVELLACDQAHDSRLISAGIAACRRAMQNVHDLFDPRVPPPCREAEIPQVLHGDLLKIPHLALNARWEPELDPLALETELLELLSKPDPTWIEVWEMHSQWHDHVATERLLELDVWGSITQRQALETVRQADIDRCRESLSREVVELRNLLEEIAEAGTLNQHDHSGFASRLERIDKSIERSADFFAVEVQLAQIRTTLERKQASNPVRPPADIDSAAKGEAAHRSTLRESAGSRKLQVSKPVSAVETSESSHRDSVWVMDFN